jgi:heme/copper-type cytochrome/quinol oxidase subunit 2
VVTKKRRRSQLARASAQRQELRRAERERRRKRVRALLTVLVVVLLVAGLVTWIVWHARDSASAANSGGGYAAYIDLPHEHPTHQATTVGESR